MQKFTFDYKIKKKLANKKITGISQLQYDNMLMTLEVILHSYVCTRISYSFILLKMFY